MANGLSPRGGMKVLGLDVEFMFESVEGRGPGGALLGARGGAGSRGVLGGGRQGRLGEWRRGVQAALGRRLEHGVGEGAGRGDRGVQGLQGAAG